jgi:predicted DNA-binding transcriptional regulator
MKNKKPNAALMWKQFEDLAPRLRLSIAERTVYSYLLRHSRLEGRRRIEFSLRELARGVCVSLGAARPAVRRLISRGVLLLVERSKVGHVAEVRTPEEILMVESGQVRGRPPCGTRTSDLEEPDFLNHPARRRTIHARERGRCFYCLGNVTVHTRCLDHVVPRVELVDNTYRNLVSCRVSLLSAP